MSARTAKCMEAVTCSVICAHLERSENMECGSKAEVDIASKPSPVSHFCYVDQFQRFQRLQNQCHSWKPSVKPVGCVTLRPLYSLHITTTFSQSIP